MRQMKNTESKTKPNHQFMKQLRDEGYSKKAIKELWNWYDYSKKKGVASF